MSDVFVAYYNDGVEKPDKADTPSPVLFVRAFSSPEAETRGGSKAYRPDVAIQPTEDEREVTEIKAQHKTNEKTRREIWKKLETLSVSENDRSRCMNYESDGNAFFQFLFLYFLTLDRTVFFACMFSRSFFLF